METIKIGKIINTHGIKGECKVLLYNDIDIDCLYNGQKLYIDNNKYPFLTINTLREHKGNALITFDEIKTMNDAEELKTFDIKAEIEDLINNNDKIFNFELIGFNVVDENNNLLGQVYKIENTPAHDIIRVRTDGKDILIPYVDAFVQNIEMDEKTIQIRVIEGLI